MEQFLKVYAYDELGFFVGETEAQKDKNGNIMMPPNTTAIPPLVPKDAYDIAFDGSDWEYKETPKVEDVEESEPYVPTYADMRRSEYPEIGDQLDAIWKGGDSYTAMKNQVEAIKEKYPKT